MCADLLDGWCAETVSNGWVSPSDWWHPAVEAVADAVALGRDPIPAIRRLGEARAEVGVPVSEALADLAALSRVAVGEAPAFDHTRALVEAHAEAVLAQLFGSTCEDPLTRLTTLSYLCTRLAEDYRVAEATGVPAAQRRALVVVQIGEPSGNPLASAVRMIDTARAVRTVFGAGETCAAAGRRRVLVLTDRTPSLPAAVVAARESVVRELPDATEVRVWVEGLPRTHDAAVRQVETLVG